MLLRFSSTVRDVCPLRRVLTIKPVAGIESILMPPPAAISHLDGSATGQDVQRGTRVQVWGIDDGTAQLQAAELLILDTGTPAPAFVPHAARGIART